eukprot:SAG11_NODE_2545_length_3234_cov_4.296332_2_plen_128_part_00
MDGSEEYLEWVVASTRQPPETAALEVQAACTAALEKTKADESTSGAEEPRTIFEQIIAREIPVRVACVFVSHTFRRRTFKRVAFHLVQAEIVYEDELCLAFHDVAPQAPVHCGSYDLDETYGPCRNS